MLNFQEVSLQTFLTSYWQKKPLIIRNALPNFDNPLSPEELAGLAMEEDFESRIVIQDLNKSTPWSLKRGPFLENEFNNLPTSHWTLLVQGVDRAIPEVAALLDDFNFIPQWRIDDIMISYATEHGGVGPHFDHYDVFLYQAKGRRKWLLTASDCNEDNYLQGLELRIMKEFKIEQEYILEEGDMLYLPSKIGHNGISLSQDCMTYSIGYRSYKDLELWDNFGEYLFSRKRMASYYQDPSWLNLKQTSQLPQDAYLQAKTILQSMIDNEELMQDWFGGFATHLDNQAQAALSCEEETLEFDEFKQHLMSSQGLIRNPLSRLAYYKSEKTDILSLYINGEPYCLNNASNDLVELIANNRTVPLNALLPFLDNLTNETFLHDLWTLQILEFLQEDEQ